jgi:ABC-type amino acid transport substrate-binding protein
MFSRRALLGALVTTGLTWPLAAQPLAKLMAAGVLRVAVYRDFEPWSWAGRDATFVGIDVDLGRAIGKALGLRVEIVDFLAEEGVDDDLRNMVWRGSLIGGMPCDLMMHVPVDRKLQLDNDRTVIFGPYCREGFAMLCNRDTTDCEVLPPQLKGKRLVAELDSIPDFYLSGSFGGVLRSDVKHVPSGAAAVSAVIAGEADAAVATRAQVEHGLSLAAHDRAQERKGSLPALPSAGWNVGLAVKDDARELSDKIDTIIETMLANGDIAGIFARYGVHHKPPLII